MIFFAEVQFLPEISYDSKGGPEFSTGIVSTFSGYIANPIELLG